MTTKPHRADSIRRLIVVLGDQLDRRSAALRDADPSRDVIWMAELASESDCVWSTKVRTAFFLAAMRHFRERLRKEGFTVRYRELGDAADDATFVDLLAADLREMAPESIFLVEPGEWRLREAFAEFARNASVPVSTLADDSFFCTHDEFQRHAAGRPKLVLANFYQEMRSKFDVLMDGGEPIGGEWSFDEENRHSFGRSGPADSFRGGGFAPDALTRQVLEQVERRFHDRPGRLDYFDWPVTREQALVALEDFSRSRLANFGPYQDAMWTGQPRLYHSRLSAAMNVKLLSPAEVVERAERAYREGLAPLASAEGFIRQILGWREFVRGIYWLHMPDYLQRNALGATEPLPAFYWTGETDMHCLAETLGQTLDLGYAHHIQRLMATGLFAMLLGVVPHEVHRWYLAVYVDAVEWVEAPNTIGMSQFGDGGSMSTKPYAASGVYISRMSDYCRRCRFDPKQALGDRACPITTLYWDFLARNERQLRGVGRMKFQLDGLRKKSTEELAAIRAAADAFRKKLRAAKSSD